MAEKWVHDFIDALHALEEQGDAERITSLFAPEGSAWNLIMPEPRRGREGVRAFWEEYRRHFTRVHSEFERVIVDGDQAALEWRADGQTQQGHRALSYRGVTLLKRGPEGISEFAGYYDPEPFRQSLGLDDRFAA